MSDAYLQSLASCYGIPMGTIIGLNLGHAIGHAMSSINWRTPPREAAFLNVQAQLEREIANVFRLPPELLR